MKLFYIIALLLSANTAFSQTIIQRDPEIEKMLKAVSPDSLQSYH